MTNQQMIDQLKKAYVTFDEFGVWVLSDLAAWRIKQLAEWFRKNYPGPDTIIHNPDWHAPKIFRAVAGLKRYDLEQPDSHMGSAKMVLETHGDWVKFDDLAALAVPEVANLVKALRQLLPQNLGPLPDHFPDSMVMPVDMTVGEIRTARAALAAMEGGE